MSPLPGTRSSLDSQGQRLAMQEHSTGGATRLLCSKRLGPFATSPHEHVMHHAPREGAFGGAQVSTTLLASFAAAGAGAATSP